MSETEHFKGTLIPEIIIDDVETTAKIICEKNGWKKSPYDDTYLECLQEDKGFFVLGRQYF